MLEEWTSAIAPAWSWGKRCHPSFLERLGSIQIVFIDFFFEAVVSAFAGVGIPGGLLHCYRAALWLGGMVRQAGTSWRAQFVAEEVTCSWFFVNLSCFFPSAPPPPAVIAEEEGCPVGQ